MSAGAIQALAKRRTGLTLSRSLLFRLCEAAGGNPFFALELARAQLADPSRDLTMPLVIPPTLEQLLEARLASLNPRTRRALLIIAAHGRLPWRLLSLLGLTEQELDTAFASRVIELSDGLISFTHPLLASAVYQSAEASKRRAAHRHLAHALTDPVERGRHLALSASEPDAQTAATLESVAAVARRRGSLAAAAELAEQALRITPGDDVEARHRRAVAAARASLDAGQGNRARFLADRLLAEAAAGQERAAALVLRSELGDHASAIPLLEEALAEAGGDVRLEAMIHTQLADAGRYTNGMRWAEQHVQAAVELAERLDDDLLRANALSALVQLSIEQGRTDALSLAERAHAIAETLADPREVKGAGWGLGAALFWSDRIERAREWLERERERWLDRDEVVQMEILWYLALLELRVGHWELASTYADEMQQVGLEYGLDDPPFRLPTIELALYRGDVLSARELAIGALTVAGEQQLPYYFGILGKCDLWTGNPEAAVAHFHRAEELADDRGWQEPNLREWRGEYARALLQLDRIDEAMPLVDDWESAAKRLDRQGVLADATQSRGLIAAARGDLSTASTLLEEAVERHAAADDPFGRARTLVALGAVRRRARQKRSARAALEEAVAGFMELGAAGWTAIARDELARIGGRTRMEGLSPSERRVAGLVAEGRTNREIAVALFLGEATVASHLHHIYAKLGIRSRTELARRFSGVAIPAPDPSNFPPT